MSVSQITVKPGDQTLHVLPCAVSFTGSVDGSKFEVSEQDGLKSYFRGRPLQGLKVDLGKHGYCGALFDENFKQKAAFKDFVVWENGAKASPTDPWVALEQLLQLSKAMD